jgi:hypothetical protein
MSRRAGTDATVLAKAEGACTMLFHLPIVILATLSPIAVSDSVPMLDVAKECRFEGGSSEIFDRCMRDENDARKQIEALWSKAGSADRASCASEATTGGYASYIELLTCLEMARDVAKVEHPSGDPHAGTESRQSDQTIGADRGR